MITDEDFPRPTRENQHSDQGREKGLRALTPPQPAAPVSAFAGMQRKKGGQSLPCRTGGGLSLAFQRTSQQPSSNRCGKTVPSKTDPNTALSATTEPSNSQFSPTEPERTSKRWGKDESAIPRMPRGHAPTTTRTTAANDHQRSLQFSTTVNSSSTKPPAGKRRAESSATRTVRPPQPTAAASTGQDQPRGPGTSTTAPGGGGREGAQFSRTRRTSHSRVRTKGRGDQEEDGGVASKNA